MKGRLYLHTLTIRVALAPDLVVLDPENRVQLERQASHQNKLYSTVTSTRRSGFLQRNIERDGRQQSASVLLEISPGRFHQAGTTEMAAVF